jgi:hypothetical protein
MKLPSGNQPILLQCDGPHCRLGHAGSANGMSAFGRFFCEVAADTEDVRLSG